MSKQTVAVAHALALKAEGCTYLFSQVSEVRLFRGGDGTVQYGVKEVLYSVRRNLRSTVPPSPSIHLI
jgi:hypothetical protein